MKRRIFIAIQIPEELKNNIEKYLKPLTDNRFIRLIKKESWHITVSFLGYLEEKEIEILKNIIEEEAKKNNSFALKTEKIIWAPPNAAKRMIWLKFEKSPEFEKLKNGIEKKILPYQKQNYFQNFRKENRNPHIHLTLARLNFAKQNFGGRARFEPAFFKKIENLIPVEGLNLKEKYGQFNVGKVDVIESILSKSGAEYKIISSFKLSSLKI